jgi:hypothetical protein
MMMMMLAGMQAQQENLKQLGQYGVHNGGQKTLLANGQKTDRSSKPSDDSLDIPIPNDQSKEQRVEEGVRSYNRMDQTGPPVLTPQKEDPGKSCERNPLDDRVQAELEVSPTLEPCSENQGTESRRQPSDIP